MASDQLAALPNEVHEWGDRISLNRQIGLLKVLDNVVRFHIKEFSKTHYYLRLLCLPVLLEDSHRGLRHCSPGTRPPSSQP